MDDKTADNSITNFEEEYSSDGQFVTVRKGEEDVTSPNLVTSPKGEDVKVILLKRLLL